ncbi:calcium-dependent kinase CDPK2B [Babesia ovis]|uniref:Calcium-dependent kinase CDPK2B n=1 Tax=Babesia ovis TaxID=5869 RepID=A0A9W5WW47_BABOV|nr:calcium-dependent kinase CDPK2B [Babesia ovis]
MSKHAKTAEADAMAQCKEIMKFCSRKKAKSVNVEEEESTQLNLTFNRFSPVLKGGWSAYKRKYLEGPIIGQGAFGVVKALFPVVEMIELQQRLPARDQLPTKKLGRGIKRISNDEYEFRGIPIPPPKRAVKIMNINNSGSKDLKDALHVLRELTIGAWLDHPNVVKISEIYTNRAQDVAGVSNEVFHEPAYLRGIETEFTKVFLVMEYCSGGDLTSRIVPKGTSEDDAARVFVQVFRALSYINTMGIAHRDVKPENFVWSTAEPDADVKLTDFGLANSPLHTLTTRAGTAYYVAPEIVRHAPHRSYSVMCDSWSAGIMLHLFLLGFCPFHGETDFKTLVKVANNEINWYDPRYDKLSSDAFDFLRRLLVKEPSRRITTSDALKHPWLRRATFEVTNIPMTVEEATGIVDALTAFYRCPVLKQLTLCLMIRQMQDHLMTDSRKKYLFLSLFGESEHFWVNTNTVEKWLMYSRELPNNGKQIYGSKQATYLCAECLLRFNRDGRENVECQHMPKRRVSLRQSMLCKAVSRLNDLMKNFGHYKMSISYTEFLAAHRMEELVHRSDLILDAFAGMRSEVHGKRSIMIDAVDLRRMLNPMYYCSNHDLDDVLRQTELIALCTYLKTLAMDEHAKPKVFHLLKFLLDPKNAVKPMNITIDEFFVLMKSSENVETVEDALRVYHGSPYEAYEDAKRRLILNKLRAIDEYWNGKRRKTESVRVLEVA